MEKLILLLSFVSFSASASELAICQGEYALCAASGAVPTGGKITVNGLQFDEAVAVCPVLLGPSVADLSLMNGSCGAPEGKVWSLFSTVDSYPQAPDWEVTPAVPRAFVTTDQPDGGMSNMWSFLCTKQSIVNGVQLADCYGPLNASPLNGLPIAVGVRIGTEAPIGVPNPVGINIPSEDK